MRWVSKDPPIYVRDGDSWKNERNRIHYVASVHTRRWMSPDNEIQMPKKTVLLGYGFEGEYGMQILKKYKVHE